MKNELSPKKMTALICKVINNTALTENEYNILDNNSDELIEYCNEHRAIPLFYKYYNNIKKTNPKVLKKCQKKFFDNLVCQKKIDITILELLKNFEKEEIRYVCLKGFALANSIYAEAYLRPFVDIDILIHPKDTAKIKKIFSHHNFRNARGWQPKYIISQFTMYKRLFNNLYCYFDVHEKISNDQKLAKLITYDDALETSFVKNVSNVKLNLISYKNAFIHSCFHLVRHQYQGDLVRIAWLYDLYLLLLALDDKEKNELLDIINEKNLNNIIRKALTIAYTHLQYDNLNKFKNNIEHVEGSMFDYLLKTQTGISRFIHKVKETSSTKDILFLMQETVFPPREEIENKYGPQKTYLLPYFYLKRLSFGLIKWFKK